MLASSLTAHPFLASSSLSRHTPVKGVVPVVELTVVVDVSVALVTVALVVEDVVVSVLDVSVALVVVAVVTNPEHKPQEKGHHPWTNSP